MPGASEEARRVKIMNATFEVYAVLHDIPKGSWPNEREKFLSKGHPHLRVSALAKRYGWGIHNNAEGKVALMAVESRD